jgi:hypothetical protein
MQTLTASTYTYIVYPYVVSHSGSLTHHSESHQCYVVTHCTATPLSDSLRISHFKACIGCHSVGVRNTRMVFSSEGKGIRKDDCSGKNSIPIYLGFQAAFALLLSAGFATIAPDTS